MSNTDTVEDLRTDVETLKMILSEIVPEIVALRDGCPWHFGTNETCDNCQEFAHLDSWLDKVATFIPEVARDDA